MKIEWLQKWFGQNDMGKPDQDSGLNHWKALLLPISSHNPIGEDVSSSDEFQEVKEQIAQLSGIDCDKISHTCHFLLGERGKDLRPAVYLSYVLLRQDGYRGLASGLELIALLLFHFGDATWPTRPMVRKSTLEWLGGARVFDWFDTLDKPDSSEQKLVNRALDLLEECCKVWPESERPTFDALRRRFSVEGQEIVREVEDRTGLTSSLPKTNVGQFEITSNQGLMDSLRSMATYLRQQPQGAFAAYRLVRGVRWDNVPTLPPHDAYNVTRLAAPRSELRQQLKRLLLQKQWHGLLEKIESAFLEGANHFWLDLQYYAWEALGQLGEEYVLWRNIVLTDLAQMRDRLSGIEQLRFNDGTNFAEDTTLEWLATHAVICDIEAGESISHVPVLVGHNIDEDALQKEAFFLAETQGLDHAFSWLQTLPQAKGRREYVFRQMVMARLAETHKRIDFALHILSALNTQVSISTICRWDPLFVFDIKSYYVHLLRQHLNRKDVNKVELTQILQQLQADLVQLDPLRALLLQPI